MPWSGSGVFNRIYSWASDKAAGIDITASRRRIASVAGAHPTSYQDAS